MALSIGSGFGPSASLPDVSAPPPERPKRADNKGDEGTSGTRREDAPPTSPTRTASASHRGLARLRHADLSGRLSRAQLRRMNRAAFGPTANSALPQQVKEVLAELGGNRAPATATHEDGDEAFKRYVVLREALELAEADPAREHQREKIEQAIDTLLSHHGNRFAGDLNIAEVLDKYKNVINSWDQLRRLYHDAVCTHTSVAQTYDTLLGTFGHERLDHALKALREAIIEDMSAPFASADLNRLAKLQADLTKVININSVSRSVEVLWGAFPSLAQIKVRAEFIARMLHLVVDGGTRTQMKQIAEWLARPADENNDDYEGPPAPPVSAAEVRAASLRPEQREEALRRFLRENVPAGMWKPNTRNAVTEPPQG
jgi:type III secretion system YopN/LcrE/InvE/MxiC family regulator